MVPRTVLFVDDESDSRELFARQVRGRFNAVLAASASEAETALAKSRAPLVVTDYQLDGGNGLELLRRLRRDQPNLMAILVSGYRDMDSLLEAINSGAIFRFVLKPWRAEDLLLMLESAFVRLDKSEADQQRVARIEELNRYLVAQSDPQIVSSGPPMTEVLEAAQRVAPTATTVLLRGESGTGKELLAQSIHRMSPRASGPFIAVNCGALAEGVLESELFGHERGAFTGADCRHVGKFELAESGTLFLDEMGDVSPKLQVALLRVLQERTIDRVGSQRTEPIKVDVRVIAATHRPLELLVEQGGFRADLYYRLNVFPLHVPPLRERPNDIPLLARTFLQRESRSLGKLIDEISPKGMGLLVEYGWPGNVRELQNVIERAAILCERSVIDVEVLARVLGAPGPSRVDALPAAPPAGSFAAEAAAVAATRAAVTAAMGEPLPSWTQRVQYERRRRIEGALLQAEGNRSRAAEILGIKRSTFLYQARKLGLL